MRKNIILLVSVVGVVALIIILTEVLGSSPSPEPSPIENNEVQNTLSKSAFIEQYKTDQTLQLGGINQELFFLDKNAFLVAAESQPQKAKSIDDFKEFLVNYLMSNSDLVQEVFGEDQEKIWSYIAEHNPDEIAAIENQITNKTKVHQLNNWNGLVIYKVEEEGVKTKTVIEDTAKVATMKTPKNSPTEKVTSDAKYANIPKLYQTEINGKLFRLELKDMEEQGDSIHFIYEVLGMHQHYNRKGTLDKKSGQIQFSSLGAARIKRRTTGQTKIIIEKHNYIFESI